MPEIKMKRIESFERKPVYQLRSICPIAAGLIDEQLAAD